jgi:hypothetical protein
MIRGSRHDASQSPAWCRIQAKIAWAQGQASPRQPRGREAHLRAATPRASATACTRREQAGRLSRRGGSDVRKVTPGYRGCTLQQGCSVACDARGTPRPSLIEALGPAPQPRSWRAPSGWTGRWPVLRGAHEGPGLQGGRTSSACPRAAATTARHPAARTCARRAPFMGWQHLWVGQQLTGTLAHARNTAEGRAECRGRR